MFDKIDRQKEAAAKVGFLGGMNSRPYVGQRLSVHREGHLALPTDFGQHPECLSYQEVGDAFLRKAFVGARAGFGLWGG